MEFLPRLSSRNTEQRDAWLSQLSQGNLNARERLLGKRFGWRQIRLAPLAPQSLEIPAVLD
jgi:hypothetical protein